MKDERERSCWFRTWRPDMVMAADIQCPSCKLNWMAGNVAGSIAKSCELDTAANAVMRTKGWRP